MNEKIKKKERKKERKKHNLCFIIKQVCSNHMNVVLTLQNLLLNLFQLFHRTRLRPLFRSSTSRWAGYFTQCCDFCLCRQNTFVQQDLRCE